MSPLQRYREALLAPLFCLAIIACADDPIDPEPTPVAELRFAVEDSLGFYAGESAPLGAVAYDMDGAPITGASVEWTSSNPAVVSVDSAGVLTAHAQGLAIVTATVDSISAMLTVRVTDFVEISAKEDPICARDVEGQVWCIGTEWLGQVNWPHPKYETWRQISGSLVFSDLGSGYQHTCGIAEVAYCWGSDEHNALGNSDVFGASTVPVRVGGGHDFVVVNGGTHHSCAIDSGGKAYCWGRGSEGQLGNGDVMYAGEPVLVAGEHTWRAIDPGWRITCGVADDGPTYCWGGTRGDVEGAVPLAHPAVPSDLELVRADEIACGSKGVTVYCWSWGEGLGEPNATTLPAPVIDLVLGDDSMCALVAGGDVYCWGSNENWLLGDADLTSAHSPVRLVVGERKFVAITGEWTLHCALADDGGVYCWGTTWSTDDRPVPPSSEPARVSAPMP